MSLDVYLTGKSTDVPCMCLRCCNEHMRKETEEFFSANITHNLNRMASAAGIYDALWRPDEHGMTKAGQLIEPLRAGIAVLKATPKKFIALEPENRWGTYDEFVPWVERYLAACEANPEADVSVSR